MSSWTEVVFETDDETNTITRNSVLSDSSLFVEVHTTAIIKSDTEEVDTFPSICSATSRKRTCIVLENQIHVFNESCSELYSSLCTDTKVDCIALDERGDFLLVGESSGDLTLIYLPSMLKLLTQRVISPMETDYVYCSVMLVSSLDKELHDVVLLAYNGEVYRMRNLDLSEVKKAITERDMEKAMQLQSSCQFDLEYPGESDGGTVKCGVIIRDSDNNTLLLSMGLNDPVLRVQSLSDKKSDVPLCRDIYGTNFRKAVLSRNGFYIFALDFNNILSVICRETFIVLKTWNDFEIIDFALLDPGFAAESLSLSEDKLGIISKSTDGQRKFQIYGFPSQKLLYSTSVSHLCHIASSAVNQEEIMFLDGLFCQDNGNGMLKGISIKSIFEILPEMRFSRLLRKKRFEEAEAFAKQFGLDLQIVYKTRLNCLLDLMTPERLSELDELQYEDLQQQFRKYLSKLTDLHHVVHCCLQIQLPTAGATRNFLIFIKSLLKKDHMASDLLAKINEIIFKLQTFELVFGEEKFRESWLQFSRSNTSEEILNHLKQSELKIAFDLWLRHEGELIKNLSGKFVEELLQAIPESVHSPLLLNWLKKNFFPVVLTVAPECLNIISLWVSTRARCLELADKHNWPTCALEFARLVPNAVADVQNKCFSRGGGTSFFYEVAQQQASAKSSDFNQLCALIINMQELEELKLDYGCSITLSDYLQLDKEAVAFQLLDWMYSPKELTCFIDGFLKSFLLQHHLVIDEVLCHYVMELLTTVGHGHWHWEETNLEDKIISIINNMSSVEEVCYSVLELSSYAPVPWSEQVHQLVADTLKLDHPYALNIQEQVRLLDIKLILLKYELHGYNTAETKQAELLVQFILHQGKPDALEDALKVARVYKNCLEEIDVYLARIRSLINDNQVMQAIELLKTLPQEMKTACCKRIVYYTISLLNVSNPWTIQEVKIFYTSASLEAIKLLSTLLEPHFFEEFCFMRQKLERIHLLQTQYKLFLSIEELDSSGEDVLDTNITKFLNSTVDAKENVKGISDTKTCLHMNVVSGVVRLGELLGITEAMTLGKLAKQSACAGNLEIVRQTSRELKLNAMHSSNAEELVQISELLLSQESNSIRLTNQIVQELAGTTVTYCPRDNIPTCLRLSYWTSFMRNLYEMDKAHEEKLLPKSFGVRTFEEIGLPLNHSVLSALSSTVLSLRGSQRKDVIPVLLTSGKLVEYLQQRGYCLLALQAMLTVVACCQVMLVDSETSEAIEPNVLSLLQKCVDLKNQLTHHLLRTVLTQKKVDYQLAIGLANSMPRSSAVSVLEDVGSRCDSNYRHLLRVQRLAFDLAKYWADKHLVSKCSSQITRLSWGLQLAKLNISFKDALHEFATEERSKVLQEIVLHPDAEPCLVEEYCMAFELNIQESLLNYLESVLVLCNNPLNNGNSTLLHIPMTHLGDIQAINGHVLSGNFQSMCPVNKLQTFETIAALNKAKAAVHMISDKKVLLRTLKSSLKQESNHLQFVSPYNYELISFLLEHCLCFTSSEKVEELHQLNRGIELLKFLHAYYRGSKTADQGMTLNEVTTENHDRRLPFHSLMYDNPWTIIKPELEFETVMTWLGVAPLLQLSSDVMLFTTVQIEMERILPLLHNVSGKHGKWANFLQPFLDKAHGLVLQIEDLSAAVACAKWITEKLPLGQEKVCSAQWTLEFANRWRTGCSPANKQAAEEACKKLSEFYQRLVTEQVLNEDKLNTTELHFLIQSPTKLVFKLYELHTGFSPIFGTKPCTDVHAAAEKIAEANNINLQKIHMMLVEKWLSPVDTGINLDESTCESPTKQVSNHYEQDELNLQRIIYILQYGCIEENVLFLLGKAFEQSPHVSYAVKYRALRCLFSIADNSTIEKLCWKKVEEFRELLRSFQYFSQLEELRLPSSIHLFQSNQMHELAEGIWKRHRNDIRVVRWMAKLCMESTTHSDTSLWKDILSQMVQFSMVEELEEVLTFLSSVTSVWDFKSFVDAWTLVLIEPFSKRPKSPVEVLREGYIDVCVKLCRCPIQIDNVLPVLYDNLMEVDLPALAVGCLFHIVDEDLKKKSLETVANLNMLTRLTDNLSEMKVKKEYFPQQLQVEKFISQHSQKAKTEC